MAGAKRKKILLVDDDEKHLRAVREILQLAGYEVSTNNQIMGTSKMVVGFEPDLILLDVNMPTLSGDRLISILKRSGLAAGTPVVFFSGYDDTILRDMVRRCGAAGYIRKGDPAVLRAKVATFLGENPQQSF